MASRPTRTPDRTIQSVTEVVGRADVPSLTHALWSDRFPWLEQGTTVKGDVELFDLGLFGSSPSRDVQARWDRLAESTGSHHMVHGRQVHGARVVAHSVSIPGRSLIGECDGHATSLRGTLLTVATADCVPVSIVDPERQVIALLHAGWRGIVAGILGSGISTLRSTYSSDPEGLYVHFGPSICGSCYDVGPEVHVALGASEPAGPEPIDLRGILGQRAMALGIPFHQVSQSTHCTRCGPVGLFSHRAGDTGRQLSYIGITGVGS